MNSPEKSSKIITLPNLLTFLRMALIPVFAILLFYGYGIFALLVFVVAGVTDTLDGVIARRWQQQSSLGTILDPIADKLLMTTSFVILSLSGIFERTEYLPVPFWVTASVIGRDVLIITVAGAIHIMTGFRGFQPSWLGKLSTVVQVTAVSLILVAAVFPVLQSLYLTVVYLIVVALAFLSGFHYIFFIAKLMKESGDAADLSN